MQSLAGLFVLILSLQFSLVSFGQTLEADRKSFLEEFSKNPAKASQILPRKYNSQGQRIQTSGSFTTPFIQNRSFIKLKDQRRQQVCGKNSKPGAECAPPASQFLSKIRYSGDVEYFTENPNVTRNLERAHLEAGHANVVSFTPWSGDYWATFKGGIAARYADSEFPEQANIDEIHQFMTDQKYAPLTPDEIDRLSPSEKYDLLVGDFEKTLTESVLQDAQRQYRSHGRIEEWWGICHGWAPAALMVPRPRRFVQIHLPNLEIPLTFFPHDLKALASHFWAHTPYRQLYIGGRCDAMNPERDQNGRVISEECFDINPGSWHLSILNQVGVKKQSFIMDATFDYEVWNQPVTAYNYIFFNPQSRQQTQSLAEAMIPIEQFSNDPYSGYRSKHARSIVGVAMSVNYVKETTASQAGFDSESDDNIVTVEYYYDLELDSEGNVIGGEWYQQAHPDFLWRPSAMAQPLSVGDQRLEGEWMNSTEPPPAQWTDAAREASKSLQPLHKVLQNLIQLSQ